MILHVRAVGDARRSEASTAIHIMTAAQITPKAWLTALSVSSVWVYSGNGLSFSGVLGIFDNFMADIIEKTTIGSG